MSQFSIVILFLLSFSVQASAEKLRVVGKLVKKEKKLTLETQDQKGLPIEVSFPNLSEKQISLFSYQNQFIQADIDITKTVDFKKREAKLLSFKRVITDPLNLTKTQGPAKSL